MRVDALNVIQLTPRAIVAHIRTAVVYRERADARPVLAGLAQHDLPTLVRFPLSQLTHSTRHPPWWVETEHLFVPRSRVFRLIDVLPVA